jgi:hypothetical protein
VSLRSHYPFVWLGLPLALILLFSFGPLVALLLGGAVADALGCNMPIAATAPCLLMGADLSAALAIAVFFGYLAFWTVPAGSTLFGIWLIAAIIVTLVWLLRRRRSA